VLPVLSLSLSRARARDASLSLSLSLSRARARELSLSRLAILAESQPALNFIGNSVSTGPEKDLSPPGLSRIVIFFFVKGHVSLR
jgi:hypothetical protein